MQRVHTSKRRMDTPVGLVPTHERLAVADNQSPGGDKGYVPWSVSSALF